MKTRQLLCRRVTAGFTLLEVMVVVLILAMIAGIVTPVVMDRLQKAKRETAKVQILKLMDAIEFFNQDQNFYPSKLEDLVVEPDDERIKDYPENGYLDGGVPVDPWGNPYKYVCPGAHGSYDLLSYGRDGTSGGTGYDADIKSWELKGARPGD